MLKQDLYQKLEQKLTPQQIQTIRLLELPILELEQRIKKELEENPALEDENSEDDALHEENEDDNQDTNETNNENDDEIFDEDFYNDDDEIPQYKLQINNLSKDDTFKEIPYSDSITFQESLAEQLSFKDITEKEKFIAIYLIGNIEEDGYIRRNLENIINDIAFSQNIEISEEEIENALKIIQDLEPTGIGARTLQECLQIQIDKKINDLIEAEENDFFNDYNEIPDAIELAKKIIYYFFEEFSKKHYDKIISKLNIDEKQLKSAIDIILKLNPKPGNSYSDQISINHYSIIPDFIIEIIDDKLFISLNEKNTPDLRINKNFSGMINDLNSKGKSQSSKEAITFIKQKIDSAKWFIDAINQRQNTLLITMNAIAEIQKDFFLTGEESKIKPMVLKNIAEITDFDISTISRVANSKYVSTPYGTYLLKYFFSEAMQTDSGEEVSSRELKNILKEAVQNENKQKPLTDDKLTEMINAKGYHIARRTIAKYREQLDIPVARLRKELK
ncbi:MAG: RNA polymerase factor sigma-54 [Bacteroidales bacterium]|jgi:RNA polymerase sigma-54 factor|nr:RNA polymerase factor sigma-54 [Bacteroidales bacterium]